MVRKVGITLAVAFSAAAATINKRIVKGENTKAGEFPFMASIHNDFGQQVCGGILLDGYNALTAAHCVNSSAFVQGGAVNWQQGGQGALVESIVIHPDFKDYGEWGPNDIAILRLSTQIKQGETISYATLPENGADPAANTAVTAIGWGRTHEKGQKVTHLAKVDMHVLAAEDCAKNIPSRNITDTMVCAGGAGKNICMGDSGGPLINQETRQIIGISSWTAKDAQGHECDQAPGVFTKVSRYIDFIEKNLRGSSSGLDPTYQEMADSREQQILKMYNDCGWNGGCKNDIVSCKRQVKPETTIEEFTQCVESLNAQSTDWMSSLFPAKSS